MPRSLRLPIPRSRRAAAPVLGALAIATAGAGCGGGDDDSDQPDRIPGTPDPVHAREVERNPYAVTCNDLARQPLHPLSQKLVIHAEFALAQEPVLRKVVRKLTLNRVGRAVYYGLKVECKGQEPSFKPARPAIAGVLDGTYRVAKNRPG